MAGNKSFLGRVGCGQGQVENRFYGVLAADMAGHVLFTENWLRAGTGGKPLLWPVSCGNGRTGYKSFLRRVSCGQGQVANRFYDLLAEDIAGRLTSPFYSELAAS